jgi:hypothetical protein
MSLLPSHSPHAPRAPAAPGPDAPAFGSAMAVVGHVSRRGRWSLPPLFRVVAWMGGVELDLTAALFPRAGAELELLAVLGVITVRVPTDVAVELVGDAITCSREPGEVVGDATPPRGTVRITGRSVLGKVHVRFVRPLTRGERARVIE